ncbi:NAD(P)-binding protein [Sodiomyces alkalinus F11]|uniref:NAD(P)-binding protein n=1 Tax=Sodiomyces alkalinus (strain CBS 110278 / VKM F-3762 / F11) TaxID=1314773 RepID=A0A3N2PYX6_SODAK|nr:NAD(P)-binding protein [Sodiomyces alkalinus F11]ROT39628.1 NAD(P)-binding protein [Sodiomyces alkalinus F11]
MSNSWTPTTWDPLTQTHDLSGKVAVVTGSNSGIGRATVKFLALRGAKVYLATRSESRTREVIEELRKENPSIGEDQLHHLLLDLADLKSIVAAADALKAAENRLDVLINNATAIGSGEVPATGWELQIAVSHVGHFTLTNLLLPLLEAAASDPTSDVRIVSVSSIAGNVFLPASYEFGFNSPAALRRPVPYFPWTWRYLSRHLFRTDMVTYAMAKTAQVLFTRELQRRLDARGLRVLALAAAPGTVYTRALQSTWPGWMDAILRRLASTVDQGAANSLFAAAAPEVRSRAEAFKGRYMDPVGRVRELHPVERNAEQVAGLWDVTEREVNAELAKAGLPGLLPW